jgi:hypothetical protein
MKSGIFTPAEGGGGLAFAPVTSDLSCRPHVLVIAKKDGVAVELRLSGEHVMALGASLAKMGEYVHQAEMSAEVQR